MRMKRGTNVLEKILVAFKTDTIMKNNGSKEQREDTGDD